MPTIQFITKINEEGVISTFEKITQTIEKSAEASDHLSKASSEHAGKMSVEWTHVGVAMAATGTAIAAMGVTATAVLFDMAEKTAQVGGAFHDMSERTGLSTQALSQFAYAAEISGASTENVVTGLKLLATHMENVVESGTTAGTAFERLGIAATDANGNLRPTSDVLLDVADRFHNMQGGAEKSAAAIDLFGRGGLALIPFLNEGREGISKLSAEAERLGIVFGTDAAAQADKFDDILHTLQNSVLGLTFAIGTQVMPIFQRWVETIVDIIIATKDWVNENPNLASSLLEIAVVMVGGGGLLIGIGSLIALLPLVIGYIGTMGGVATATAVEVGIMGEAILTTTATTTAATGVMGALAGGLELIGGVLLGPVGIIAGVVALAAGLIYLVNKTESGHSALVEFSNIMKQNAIDALKSVEAVGEFVATLAQIGSEFVKPVWDDAKSWFTIFSEAIKAVTSGFVDLSGWLPNITDKFERALNPMSGIVGVLKDLTPLLQSLSNIGPPPSLLPVVPDPHDLQAISDTMRAAHMEFIKQWDADEKQHKEDVTKSNDIYIGYFADFYKHQYDIGIISSEQLTGYLLQQEDARYANEVHTNANKLAAEATHQINRLKITQDGEDRLSDIEMKSFDLAAKINQARFEDSNEALSLIYSYEEKAAQRKYELGMISGGQLRALMLYYEDRRWEILTSSHIATEAEETQHYLNRLEIQSKYADDSLIVDQGLEEMKKFMRENDAKGQEEIDARMSDSAKVRSKEIIDTLKKHHDEATELGKDIEREWSSAMDRLGKNVATAIAGMVTSWQFNADTLIKIAQSTATSMLSALLQGMITPLTNELAKLGTQITDTILGIGKAGGTGGGLLGLVGGLFGGGTGAGFGGTHTAAEYAAAGWTQDAVTGGTVGGGTFGAGALTDITSFLGSTVGIATLGIGAAVAGIISWVKSQAHHEADDLVKTIQAPFDTNFAQLVDMITVEFANGTQNQRDLAIAQVGMHELWGNVNQTVEQWRTAKGNSSDRNKVAAQFHQTEDPFIATQLHWIDALANEQLWRNPYRDNTISESELAKLPRYATGTTRLLQDGPIFAHKDEAIIPAAMNPWNPSAPTRGTGGASMTFQFGDINVTSAQSNDPEVLGEQVYQVFVRKLRKNSGDIQGMLYKKVQVQV